MYFNMQKVQDSNSPELQVQISIIRFKALQYVQLLNRVDESLILAHWSRYSDPDPALKYHEDHELP